MEVKKMRRYLLSLIVIILLIYLGGEASAQFPFCFGQPNPFLFPFSYIGLFPSPFVFLTPLPPFAPFPSVGFGQMASLSLLSPIRMPQPMLRQAAATVTIFFNPTQSIIQVTVLPLSPLTAPAPVTAVAPTVTAPAVGLTALALLPLLTGLTGPTQTKTLTRLATTTPAVPALTGLTALLPLI